MEKLHAVGVRERDAAEVGVYRVRKAGKMVDVLDEVAHVDRSGRALGRVHEATSRRRRLQRRLEGSRARLAKNMLK